jgi:hypothetical protein
MPPLGGAGVVGSWEFDSKRSSEIGRFGPTRMDLEREGDTLRVIRFISRERVRDVIVCRTDGTPTVSAPADKTITETLLSGIRRSLDDQVTITGSIDPSGVLTIVESCTLRTSQGTYPATISHQFAVEDNGETLRHTVRRSTRQVQPEAHYVYRRARDSTGRRSAVCMELGENWELDGDLPLHAALVSLQGVVNRNEPRLYFIYPGDWDFKFTRPVFEFLRNSKGFEFRGLTGLDEALRHFSDQLNGFVIWDPGVRTSLIVAYTIAGLENALVVTEAQLASVQAQGMQEICDLRDVFVGMTDAQIYQWAFERYWDRCSRDYVVWLGGEHGKVMKPGVADWGMYKRAFFTDLSARPGDTEEYALANKLLAGQNPQSYVFGWHSYRKDTEGEHVTLTSSHGLRMEGLHTLPNMSFSSQIPVSPGFEFKNNHTVRDGDECPAANKVYVACIQTDCLGIGAWTEPGRGEIPYSWEVTMNWVWLAPAMMEFFYSQATPEDYFIGALSGPGYMYPGAVPPDILPGHIADAYKLMQKLDLRVFEIMDFSRIRQDGGTPDLSPEIVKEYYAGMPGAIGFVNGYFPAHTFTVENGVPLVSFDYYLSPTRPEEEAEGDIRELAVVNEKRPYFLLIHVRNFSDIRRVVRILDRLPDEFEVIPLDRFLKMAGENWTFSESFADHGGTQRYPME